MQPIVSPDLLPIYRDPVKNLEFLTGLRGKFLHHTGCDIPDPKPIGQRACEVFRDPSFREPQRNSVEGLMKSCIRQLNERGDLPAEDIIKTHIALLHVLNRWTKGVEGATITFIVAILNCTDAKVLDYSEMVRVFDVMKAQYPIPGAPVIDGATQNETRRGRHAIDLTVQGLIRKLGMDRAHALIIDYLRDKLGQESIAEPLLPPPPPLTDSMIASAPLPAPICVDAPEPPPVPPRKKSATFSDALPTRSGDDDLFASIRARSVTLHHVEPVEQQVRPKVVDDVTRALFDKVASMRKGLADSDIDPVDLSASWLDATDEQSPAEDLLGEWVQVGT